MDWTKNFERKLGARNTLYSIIKIAGNAQNTLPPPGKQESKNVPPQDLHIQADIENLFFANAGLCKYNRFKPFLTCAFDC